MNYLSLEEVNNREAIDTAHTQSVCGGREGGREGGKEGGKLTEEGEREGEQHKNYVRTT